MGPGITQGNHNMKTQKTIADYMYPIHRKNWKRPKDPKELIEGALGNNAEPQKDYPDWDESFLADMQIKEMAERWDR
jgi:hypothetical protein